MIEDTMADTLNDADVSFAKLEDAVYQQDLFYILSEECRVLSKRSSAHALQNLKINALQMKKILKGIKNNSVHTLLDREVQRMEAVAYHSLTAAYIKDLKHFMETEYDFPADRFWHTADRKLENDEIRRMSESGRKFHEKKFIDTFYGDKPKWLKDDSYDFISIALGFNRMLAMIPGTNLRVF